MQNAVTLSEQQPPRHDDAAERAILGAVLSAGALGPEPGWNILDRARAIGLTAEAFYSRSLAAIWSELEALRDDQIALDALTVSSEIERRAEERVGALGEFIGFDIAFLRSRLHALATEAVAFGNVEHWARIVVREWERRTREAA